MTDQPPDATILMAHPKVLYFKTDEFGYDAVRTPMDLPIAQLHRSSCACQNPSDQTADDGWELTADYDRAPSRGAHHRDTDCKSR